MTDSSNAVPPESPSTEPLPDALPRRRPRMSAIWVIPIVAALIALWLGYQTWSEEGPTISVTFQSADGLEAGKTQVKHKNVNMGVVSIIKLSSDMSHVILKIAMTREAAPHLTESTRFWVVKPRFGVTGVSGLDTLVSGSYIEMDPGGDTTAHEEEVTAFTGLETPPIIRTGEPGTEYVLITERLGSLTPGAPIFYRDVQVGEVLGYDLDHIETSVTVHIFVRAPYDKHIFQGTRFWNASGITLSTGPEGFHLQLESLVALLAGGIAFDTPNTARAGEPAQQGTIFTLYRDSETASYAGAPRRDQFLAFFDGSVGGLAPGSQVQVRGIPVGRVVEIRLHYDPTANALLVPVLMEFDPEAAGMVGIKPGEGLEIITKLVKNRGLRAQLQSGSLITGQQVVALDFFPDAPAAEVTEQMGYPVIPSVPSNLENIINSVEGVAKKLAALPLDELVADARDTIASLDSMLNGPEVKSVLTNLAGTLTAADQLLQTANTSLGPAFADLPKVMTSVRGAMKEVNVLLGSLNQGYGNESDFRRDLNRTLRQAEEALRSIRVLADFLEQNPQALILGTGDQ